MLAFQGLHVPALLIFAILGGVFVALLALPVFLPAVLAAIWLINIWKFRHIAAYGLLGALLAGMTIGFALLPDLFLRPAASERGFFAYAIVFVAIAGGVAGLTYHWVYHANTRGILI